MGDRDPTCLPTALCRAQRVVLPGGARTWTVLDGDHRVVAAAEEYLEYLRMLGRSPNTVKSYARALALWWQFLAAYELAWAAVTVEDLGRFLGWLRSGDGPALASIERRPARFREGTVALRLQAVCSFYRYQHFNGVEAASRLYERVFSGRYPYKPMLEHLARRRGHDRRVVRVAPPRPEDAADAHAGAGRERRGGLLRGRVGCYRHGERAACRLDCCRRHRVILPVVGSIVLRGRRWPRRRTCRWG